MSDDVHMMISIPPSMRFRRWGALSKARAPFIGRACTGNGNEPWRIVRLGLGVFRLNGRTV